MSDEQPVFSIEKIYVKDLSLEVPNAPRIFLERETPSIEVQIQSAATNIGDGMYEVALTVTVSAKNGETAFFLVEVVKGGIFQIRNVPEQDLEPILAVACPNILFPYARETSFRCDQSRRLPARDSRAGQFRGALPAAPDGAAAERKQDPVAVAGDELQCGDSRLLRS
jgi:protein-export chaperone SecB